MTNHQAAKILADFNRWRKGEIIAFPMTSGNLGLALDLPVKALKK